MTEANKDRRPFGTQLENFRGVHKQDLVASDSDDKKRIKQAEKAAEWKEEKTQKSQSFRPRGSSRFWFSRGGGQTFGYLAANGTYGAQVLVDSPYAPQKT